MVSPGPVEPPCPPGEPWGAPASPVGVRALGTFFFPHPGAPDPMPPWGPEQGGPCSLPSPHPGVLRVSTEKL